MIQQLSCNYPPNCADIQKNVQGTTCISDDIFYSNYFLSW